MTTAVARQRLQQYGSGAGQAPAYLEQEVMSWSPEKIILKTYDLFLTSARRGDEQRMRRILAELINALNFDYGELPQRLLRLYEYCQRCVAMRRYEDAAMVIAGLRQAWAEAFHLE
ncbi:MAG: flagellar export chaperone FliS [Bacteroidota bacterium]|nr:flagellar export chaperone FliS [Bacteroidota bacterium]